MTPTADETEAIRQLLAKYNFAIDLGDPEGWADCFTPDGTFECIGVPEDSPMGGRHEGRDGLVAYAQRHYATAKGHARHWNWNLAIDIDGDRATMQCYLLALSVGRNRLPQLGGAGIYRDKLRRTDDGWRFESRHVTVDT